MIRLDESICRDLEQAMSREWLETNGLGGFASSTIAGINTRRYHGLLVAATKPPVGRLVLLSKLEETVVVNGERFELSANRYPGVVHPQGHRYLQEFRLDPFPSFIYRIAGMQVEKTVCMVHGENTVVVRYRLQGGEAGRVSLELRPLIAFRDHHSTTHENGALDSRIRIDDGVVSVEPYAGLPRLYLAHKGAHVDASGEWYRNFEYDVERARGLDYREDLFNPMVLRFDDSRDIALIASTEPRQAGMAQAYEAEERARRARTTAAANDDEFVRQLTVAADQFIVSRGTHKTIIAGYHWFADWGRDTMIALPGLTLATGRFEDARSILLEFAKHVDRGMLPNRFPEEGEEAEYNTVDATLWFFEAVRSYLQHTGDRATVRSPLYPVLAEIIDWHFRGTRHGIRVDSDGLLNCGEPGVQLTWMDAKVGDWVVTPRHGKPVEIQALWYNALMFMAETAAGLGDRLEAERYGGAAERARASFVANFWNKDGGYLYDVVNGTERDASIRPNQIFAVSLPHTMVPPEMARAIVATLERELLTPFGLRTLARTDPQYRPTYGGDVWSRDSAYHQGTVWPWLMGPFITAYTKVNGRAGVPGAEKWLSELQKHIKQDGLGQISEVFSGDPPHEAGGCIAQAWSVAELLRVCVQESLSLGALSEAPKKTGSAVAEAAKPAPARKRRTSA